MVGPRWKFAGHFLPSRENLYVRSAHIDNQHAHHNESSTFRMSVPTASNNIAAFDSAMPHVKWEENPESRGCRSSGAPNGRERVQILEESRR